MGTKEWGKSDIKRKVWGSLSRSKFYICIMLAFVITYCLWVGLWRYEEGLLIGGANLIALLGFSIPLISFTYVIKHTNGKEKTFWILIILGEISYIVGEISWNYYELLLKVEAPYPGWPDFFYLLCPWLFIVAMVYRISSIKNKYLSIRFVLDMLLVMVIVSTLSIQYLITPIFSEANVSNLYIIVSIAYPVSDLVLLFGVVYLCGRRDKGEMRIYSPMMWGIFLFLITDTFYLYLNSRGAYNSGGIIDLLWVISLLLVGLSAVYRVEYGNKEDSWVYNNGRQPIDGSRAFFYAPYALIILLGLMFGSKAHFDVVSIGSAVGILIIMVRQNFTLLDNKRLLVQLKAVNDELVKVNFITEIDSKTDFLTELYNRRCIEDVLDKFIVRAREEGQEFSVLMIDIDFFKNVNDEFGHEAGDFVLKEISKILMNNLRSKEIVGRYGGEEFIGILPEVDMDGALVVAERLRREVAKNDFIFDRHKIKITISIGVSEFRMNEDENKYYVLRRADKALYEAKHRGRNRTVMA